MIAPLANVPQRILAFSDDLTRIRRDFHAHPELGFTEHRTSDRIAALLSSWGIETVRGIGGTGVVGIIEGRHPGKRYVGLRSDMDALPITETTNLPWQSTRPGCSHACGHDGHMAMLLGAARYLAETREFKGRVVLIFQPAEEGLGGARAMLKDGVLDRFPLDEIYGIHNSPNLQLGEVSVFPGPAMAGADFFDFTVAGKGSHAARPQDANDPIAAVVALVNEINTIVSRNLPPNESTVVSVTRIHSGTAYNVIPSSASVAGTVRAFSDVVREAVRIRMREIAAGVGLSFRVEVSFETRDVFSVLVNHPEETAALVEIAGSLFGDRVLTASRPVMGSEDFADFLAVVPGSFCWLGHSGDVALHNPGFVFDDQVLPLGAALYAKVAETRLV
ncbi:amidohydrolase [Microvirga pudoricolor]|uniref:amidohydrolase n=1 Tax=Microvirga pudoricolor TaxID=2778729 RepID=UPI001951887D|nr:amidohydrolase [Microvirga pudoricolor]MBM6595537.1 amidohydrolase [Microvirga pudoricolor]